MADFSSTRCDRNSPAAIDNITIGNICDYAGVCALETVQRTRLGLVSGIVAIEIAKLFGYELN